MPRKRKSAKPDSIHLAALPRLPDLVIEGGRRPLSITLRDGDKDVVPQMVIWIDAQSHFIRGTRLVNPDARGDDGISAALEVLISACTGPFIGAPAGNIRLFPQSRTASVNGHAHPWSAVPGLPAKIRVNDEALAQAARVVFAPLDVPIEYVPELPTFDEIFRSMASYLGAEDEPRGPFTWDIDPAPLSWLYKAAAGYWRRAPWNYMPDFPPVALDLGERGPEPGVTMLYASILGSAGTVRGVALYYSLDDLRQAVRRGEELVVDEEQIDDAIALLRQVGAPVDELRQICCATS